MEHLKDLNLKWRNDKQCNTKNGVTDLCIQMIKNVFKFFNIIVSYPTFIHVFRKKKRVKIGPMKQLS